MPSSRARYRFSPSSSKVLTRSKFRILRLFGYLPQTDSEQQAVYRLVSFFLFCILLVVLVCLFVLGLVSFLTSNNVEISKPLEIIVALIFAVIGSVIGFDMVKEVIEAEIHMISEKRFQEGKQEAQLDERIRSGSEFRTSWEKYYLACIGNSGISVSEVRLTDFSESLCSERNHSLSQFMEGLEHSYSGRENKMRLRCAIHRLPDRFWENIATAGALTGLGWQRKDLTKLEEEPYRLLFNDIYIYLKAWLICSIDNDTDMLMPVEPIGLRYLCDSSLDVPDIEVYRKAFLSIGEIFRSELYRESIPGIKNPGVEDPLSTNQTGTKLCIEVASYLERLLPELEKFINHTHNDNGLA